MARVSQRITRLLAAVGLGISFVQATTVLAAESNFVHTIYLVRHGTYVPDAAFERVHSAVEHGRT
jgi:hypothetical protein